MKDAAENYHDYLIEEVRVGPRQELRLLIRTPMNEPFAWLRFPAITDYSVVQDWFHNNEQDIEVANMGNMLIRIENCICKPVNSQKCLYSLLFDSVDKLSFHSRRVQELKYVNE